MPLLSSRASGSVRAFGLTVLSALTSVLDLFNRADQSGLGSIKGQRWRVWRGVWSIVSNKASSSSAAGDNALATLKFTKTDVSVKVSGAQAGTGIAFWVTDADNWWAAIYEQHTTCQTCYTCNAYGGGTCNAYSFVCQNYTTVCASGYNCSSCNSYPLAPGNCNAWDSYCNVYNTSPPVGFCWGPSRVYFCSGNYNPPYYFCGGYTPACCNFATECASGYTVCNSSNPVFCNSASAYPCNCTNDGYITVFKSVASVVTQFSSSLFTAAVQSFKTILSGSNITVKAYSDTAYSSQIGSDFVMSPTTPNKNKNHGIIKSQSSLNQGSSINEFGVE